MYLKTLIAQEMTIEATSIFGENVRDIAIPKKAIVKLPNWKSSGEGDTYACKYRGFTILTYVENGDIMGTEIIG